MNELEFIDDALTDNWGSGWTRDEKIDFLWELIDEARSEWAEWRARAIALGYEE